MSALPRRTGLAPRKPCSSATSSVRAFVSRHPASRAAVPRPKTRGDDGGGTSRVGRQPLQGWVVSSGKGVRNLDTVQNHAKLIYGQSFGICLQSNDSGQGCSAVLTAPVAPSCGCRTSDSREGDNRCPPSVRLQRPPDGPAAQNPVQLFCRLFKRTRI